MIQNVLVKKPWGAEYTVVKKGAAVRLLHIKKGHETSYHCHLKKDVLMILINGRARMERGGKHIDYLEDVEMIPCFVRQIPKGVFHKTVAIEDATVLEIETTDDIHDLVRGQDKYKRGQGYEKKHVISVDEVLMGRGQ